MTTLAPQAGLAASGLRMSEILTALSYALTINDPKVFTAAWSQEFEILAKPEWEKDGLFEYVCQENNRCPGGKCIEP